MLSVVEREGAKIIKGEIRRSWKKMKNGKAFISGNASVVTMEEM